MTSEKYFVPLPAETIKNNLENFSEHWVSQLSHVVSEGGANGTEMRFGKQFCMDFLECLGISSARSVEFEAPAIRFSTGSFGRVDALIPGVFIGEIKSVNVEVDLGFRQLRDYLMGESFSSESYPRLAIATNFYTFNIWSPANSGDHFRGDEIIPLEVDLDSISDLSEYFHDALSNRPPIDPSGYEVQLYDENEVEVSSGASVLSFSGNDSSGPSPVKILFLFFVVFFMAVACS